MPNEDEHNIVRTFSGSEDNPLLVDKMIGTAYEHVKHVARNIDPIIDVANNIEEVVGAYVAAQTIAEEIAEVDIDVNAAAESALLAQSAKTAAEAARDESVLIKEEIDGLVVVEAKDLWDPELLSGNGVNASFTLSREPVDGKIEVFINDEYVTKDLYSLVGSVLTFATAPAAGVNNITVQIGGALAQTFSVPSNRSVTGQKLSVQVANEIAAKAGRDVAVRVDENQVFTPAQKGVARANTDADLLSGFRNKIINGNFDVWQRGIAPISINAGATKYTADRWVFTAGSGSANTVEYVYSSDRSAPTLSWQRSSGGITESTLCQRIEDVRTLRNSKATVTFWAIAAASINLTVQISQVFGSGGSATVNTISRSISVGTTWAKHSLVFDIPSINGKGIGNNNYIELQISRHNTGSNTTLQLSRVSLVEGDATAEADPFSPRHIQQEIALCQRYYQICSMLPGAYFSTAVASVAAILPVQLRVTPTITVLPGASMLEPGIGNRNILSVSGSLTSGIGGQIDVTTTAVTNDKPMCFVRDGSLSFDAEL